ISADAASGNAGNITVVAGAAFTNNAGNVSITGASTSGGPLDLAAGGNTLANLNARSLAGAGNGGNIAFIAFDGTENNGFISTAGGTPIRTAGNGAGSNGNFLAMS